jgi:hypothetical protein
MTTQKIVWAKAKLIMVDWMGFFVPLPAISIHRILHPAGINENSPAISSWSI